MVFLATINTEIVIVTESKLKKMKECAIKIEVRDYSDENKHSLILSLFWTSWTQTKLVEPEMDGQVSFKVLH